MVDHSQMKLGRLAPTHAQRMMAPPIMDFLTKPLPVAPPTCDNTTGAPIGMWDNNKFGNCTFAALANYAAICSHKESTLSSFKITPAMVSKAYFEYTGGKDEGAVETLVLHRAMTAGFDFGYKDPYRIATFVSVPIANVAACKSLMALFNGLYLGVNLPLAAQNQKIWTAPKNMAGVNVPGSWGGHALLAGNYDLSDLMDLVTWGELQKVEQEWLFNYCTEAYVLLDEARAGIAGVDWEMLMTYLRSVPMQ